MDVTAKSTQDGSHRMPSAIGFWFLVTLAMVGFVPTVMIPVWDDYQALVLALGEEQRINDAMERDIDRLERRRVMIETDPAVTVRASRRELGFRKAGDLVVQVPVTVETTVDPGTDEANAATYELPAPPDFLRGFLANLPPLDYRAVFVDEPSRSMILAMSGTVLLAAFTIYHGQSYRRRPARHAG